MGDLLTFGRVYEIPLSDYEIALIDQQRALVPDKPSRSEYLRRQILAGDSPIGVLGQLIIATAKPQKVRGKKRAAALQIRQMLDEAGFL